MEIPENAAAAKGSTIGWIVLAMFVAGAFVGFAIHAGWPIPNPPDVAPVMVYSGGAEKVTIPEVPANFCTIVENNDSWPLEVVGPPNIEIDDHDNYFVAPNQTIEFCYDGEQLQTIELKHL